MASATPHILWQVQHQWPTLEFMRNATDLKMAASGALEFMVKQLLGMISSDLVWLVGLGWLLIARRSRPWRLFGFAYVAIALLLMASGRSRAGYLTPAYLPLLAGGATALESFSGRRGWRWTRFALPLLMLALSARIAPLALPLLPVERYLAYARSMGVAPSTEERKQMGPLPQHFADMHGWHELEALVDSTYRGLTTEERTHCAVVARNYGEAGAVTVLGRRDGLPRAVSGHNNFWLWGPGNADGRVMIVIGGGEGEQHEQFESVEMIGRWNAPYAMPYEQNRVIWLCRGLKRPLSEWWAERKSYD